MDLVIVRFFTFSFWEEGEVIFILTVIVSGWSWMHDVTTVLIISKFNHGEDGAKEQKGRLF